MKFLFREQTWLMIIGVFFSVVINIFTGNFCNSACEYDILYAHKFK